MPLFLLEAGENQAPAMFFRAWDYGSHPKDGGTEN